MEFKASLDKTAKVITVGVGILFAFLITLEILSKGEGVSLYPVSIGLIAIYIIVYLYSPQSYTITQSSLIINRPARNLSIRKKDIESVSILESGQLNNALRTFGVGGLFGYYGSFYNYGIGGTTWYITRRDKAVIIKTNCKRIVLSPDDSEAFIKALQD